MKTLVMAGGVAANSHLRSALSELCERKKVKFVCPPKNLCGDNAPWQHGNDLLRQHIMNF